MEIPSLEELHRQWDSLCPARFGEKSVAATGQVGATVEYEVQNGESLFDIARQQLGQASRYLEILELNLSSLPETTSHMTPLPAGLVLQLPKD